MLNHTSKDPQAVFEDKCAEMGWLIQLPDSSNHLSKAYVAYRYLARAGPLIIRSLLKRSNHLIKTLSRLWFQFDVEEFDMRPWCFQRYITEYLA